MKSIDLATQQAYVAASDSGIRIRNLVWFRVRTLDGTGTADFAFWNDLDTVTIPVLRGDTGVTENRDYVGDGSLISVGAIAYASDLTVQSVNITLSQIHPTVQNMARGYDCRQARVEIHRVLFNPATNAIVGPAHVRFIGKVNKAPVATPKSGDEGGINITCVSHIRELTRTNPAKKSDETQKRRSGDRARRYIGVAGVDRFWGQEKQKGSGSSPADTHQNPASGGGGGTGNR